MKTEVILTHNIVGLGAESDQVKVAPGFARNYLFPQRLAIPLTQANRRHIEALKRKRAEREAHEFNTMTELAKGVQKLICVIKVKTGDDGKMFGSVTSGMIADELKHQFDITLDKKKIHLEHPIKTVGEYELELHLHSEVKSTLKVHVQSLTAPAAPAAAAPEAKPEEPKKPKTEKRGHYARHSDADKAKAEAAPESKEKKSHAKETHAAKGEKHAPARGKGEKHEKKGKGD
ncbi:MAG TPA: 50S ribosomal protein L9 [Verrucomicrobiae bacterium]|nr:50S ribosomal protein L9 [Verrucomicrobiae bacterium]